MSHVETTNNVRMIPTDARQRRNAMKKSEKKTAYSAEEPSDMSTFK